MLHRGYDLRGHPQVELTLEAVIVGVLLFTPLLLLLPTGAVFYALLAGLHLAASSLRLALAASALLAARGPLAAVAVRLAQPGLFPCEPRSFRTVLARNRAEVHCGQAAGMAVTAGAVSGQQVLGCMHCCQLGWPCKVHKLFSQHWPRACNSRGAACMQD